MKKKSKRSYIEKRDALIPRAEAIADRISKQYQAYSGQISDGAVKAMHAKVFSSAMDSLAYSEGITHLKPMKPIDFWESESERWKKCGEAIS